MSRVSENSSTASLKFALNKAKSKLEDLQMKGSTLKNVNRPSDDPMANVESLTLGSMKSDNQQYLKNMDFALMQINVTENSIEQLTELLSKAKEIAIAQASDFYAEDIRKNVSNEVHQLRNQALAIANRRIGQKYIFAGYKSLQQPFNNLGEYLGDKGRVSVEVSKDFFVPINLHGEEIFFSEKADKVQSPTLPLKEVLDAIKDPNLDVEKEAKAIARELASQAVESFAENKFEKRHSLFSQLEALAVGLENNDTILIQSLLENFDDSISRLISLRTRLGSISTSIANSRNIVETNDVSNAERRGQLVDADIAELFADISQQESILKTTYKANAGMMNQSLLDFLR